MADVKTENEPSIEEILASIRQIISEDDTPAGTTTAQAAASGAPQTADISMELSDAPGANGAADDDVLDLTEKADTFASDLDLSAKSETSPPPAQPQPPTQPAAPSQPADALLSDFTADAAASSMAKLLATNVALERADVPGRVGNVTLEDMARDLMRPLIKSWLDQNLPGIVEKMVQKEIEKVSRRVAG